LSDIITVSRGDAVCRPAFSEQTKMWWCDDWCLWIRWFPQLNFLNWTLFRNFKSSDIPRSQFWAALPL